MPLTIEMHESNRILCLKYLAPLLLQEIFDIYPKDKAYRDAVNHKVHTYIDVRQMGEIPSGILSTRFAPGHLHPNSGYIVVVGASNHAQVLGAMMAQLQGENYFRFFDSEVEAWDFLNETIAKDKLEETASK
jgi:hypothetical protein